MNNKQESLDLEDTSNIYLNRRVYIADHKHFSRNVEKNNDLNDMFTSDFDDKINKLTAQAMVLMHEYQFDYSGITLFLDKKLYRTYGYDITTETGILTKEIDEKCDGVIALIGEAETVSEILKSDLYKLIVNQNFGGKLR